MIILLSIFMYIWLFYTCIFLITSEEIPPATASYNYNTLVRYAMVLYTYANANANATCHSHKQARRPGPALWSTVYKLYTQPIVLLLTRTQPIVYLCPHPSN